MLFKYVAVGLLAVGALGATYVARTGGCSAPDAYGDSTPAASGAEDCSGCPFEGTADAPAEIGTAAGGLAANGTAVALSTGDFDCAGEAASDCASEAASDCAGAAADECVISEAKCAEKADCKKACGDCEIPCETPCDSNAETPAESTPSE